MVGLGPARIPDWQEINDTLWNGQEMSPPGRSSTKNERFGLDGLESGITEMKSLEKKYGLTGSTADATVSPNLETQMKNGQASNPGVMADKSMMSDPMTLASGMHWRSVDDEKQARGFS